MKYNMWSIKKAIKRNIGILNSNEEFTNVDKIESFEEGINKAIEVIMNTEWPEEEKVIICARIREILEAQKKVWSN